MLQDAIYPTNVEQVVVELQRQSIAYVKFWAAGKPLRPVNGFRDQLLAGVDTDYPSTCLGQDRLGVVAKTASNIQNRSTVGQPEHVDALALKHRKQSRHGFQIACYLSRIVVHCSPA